MKKSLLASLLLCSGISYANSITVDVYLTKQGEEKGQRLGQVVLMDSAYGLLIKPELMNLKPGLHGLHLHEKADCGDMGKDAGEHFDPQKTKTHQGPFGKGHLGDLPALYVDANGSANQITLAPRLKAKDLQGLSLMIHEGGDNYSDNPPLGGGGARLGCGVIKKTGS